MSFEQNPRPLDTIADYTQLGHDMVVKRNAIRIQMGPFDVTKEMIGSLSDVALRSLLAKLLDAEARKRGIDVAGIAVGGHQNAGDGGVDAAIEWQRQPDPEGWLLRRTIYFQSKAETMPAGKIDNEMRRKGVIRPIFAELAAKQGAYVIFSTDDPAKPGEEKRVAAMREALADVAGGETIDLRFYGADKIARWTNDHPGVAQWVLEQSGRPVAGWRRFGGWSANTAEGKDYLLDETARATIAGEEVDSATAIARMRAELNRPGGVVRLIGLSGMGKTRLAEALFDDRIDPATALSPARAIYGDAGLDLAIGAALMTEQLAVSGVDAVIVVDNCNQTTHGQLSEIVARGDSRASLLTIDYDVLGDQPEGLLVRLGENSDTILEDLLKQRFPNLRQAERYHLAKFSGGNARIAVKIAEAGGQGVDLSKLKDSELLDRLFRTGRQELDRETRAAAEAAALVYAFYVEDGDGHPAEHPLLADLAEISTAQFFRATAMLLEWGVVQQRGPQRAVMPPPLANMLAAPRIRRSDPKQLIDQFMAGPPRLLASFARRIGQLHDEPAAVAIAERLIGYGGPFADLAHLGKYHHRAFVQAAPVVPELALEAIERALAGLDRDLILVPDETRKALSSLVVLIGHDDQLFERAMEVLLQFTLADGDTRQELQARSYLLERFWPVLSFTMADPDTRFAVINRMLDDENEDVQNLGVEALSHALQSGHFTSSLNLEFGARIRQIEWRPGKGENYEPWFAAAYDGIVKTAQRRDAIGEEAKDVVATHFRQHLGDGFHERAIAAMRAAKGERFWGGGWRAINDALHFARRPRDEAKGLPAYLPELVALEEEFRPHAFDDLFEAFVLAEPWRHWHPAGRAGKTQRFSQRLARAVGQCAGRRRVDLIPYLDRAVPITRMTNMWAFMSGLGRTVSDLDDLWDAAYARFAADPHHRASALLGGLLNGARLKNPEWVEAKLDTLVTDPLLGQHLVAIHTHVPLDAAAVKRFSAALASGTADAPQFSNLMAGGATGPIPALDLAAFLRELFARDDGIDPALDILYMRLFGDRDDKAPIDPALIALGLDVLADPRIYASTHRKKDHEVGEIGGHVLGTLGGADTARAICIAMREASEIGYASDTEYADLAKLIMKLYPAIVFEEIIGKSDNDHLVERFLGPLADQDDDHAAEPEGDVQALLDWIAEDPQPRAERVAHVVRYTVKDAVTGELLWSALALSIIALAPNPIPVLQAFERRFFSGAGWGPFVLRFVRRRPLVTAMVDHEDSRIRSWSRVASRNLEASIRRWDKLDRDNNSRFED